MAHFLFCTAVAAGHIGPTLPICRALVERGHQVGWITGRIFKDRIEAFGVTYYPLPESLDLGEKDPYVVFPELGKLKGLAQFKWYLKNIFLNASFGEIEAIDAVMNCSQVDVLIGDPVMFGVYYKSELSGIPIAMISVNVLALPSRDIAPFGLGILPGRGVIMKARNWFLNWLADNLVLRDLNAHANRIRRQLGLPPRRGSFTRGVFEFPALVMQLTSPAFEYPRSDQPANLHFVGPVLPVWNRAFSPPAWWTELNGSRPAILVTQGTVSMQADDLYLPAIEALKDQNILVLTIPVTKHSLPTIPENVRAEKFIPFDHLLPHIDLMVTNGGYGAVQLALAHGVPLVVAGLTEDHMEVAARVEWSGAGINLRQQRPSPSKIKKAVLQVLSDPSYKENAQRIQRDFSQYNGPQRAVELLEMLVKQN